MPLLYTRSKINNLRYPLVTLVRFKNNTLLQLNSKELLSRFSGSVVFSEATDQGWPNRHSERATKETILSKDPQKRGLVTSKQVMSSQLVAIANSTHNTIVQLSYLL